MSAFVDIDPAEWIGSNELAFAVRDAFPVSPGHALVIPRRVIAEWWDATRPEQHAILELIDATKRRIDAEHQPEGYNVGFNAGAAAGQTVPHLHVHLIPRYDGDVPDPRGGIRHVIPSRGNYLLNPAEAPPLRTSPPPSRSNLVTPFDGRLRLELIRCLIREDLDRIDLLVSFVMRSGLNLIARRLDEALERGAHLRLLTTDYLQITDASALGYFLDRLDTSAPGTLEVRVFSDPRTSFHPKAYIFSSSTSPSGIAFVGSSNLSHSGITSGVEWNIETREVTGLRREFDQLWSDPRSVPLTADWLSDYDQLRRERRAPPPDLHPTDGVIAETPISGSDLAVDALVAEFAPDDDTDIPTPWTVQAEGLSALVATRADGHQAGLVVMATGLGKTWLAAFDSTRPEFRRVLFVAHREEILRQARDIYRQIRPAGSLTLFTGEEHSPGGDVVFASIQSLHRHLDQFEPEHFDYVVIDEFHHAAATTYRRVIAHFQPRFLLGLTATSDRADAADLLALCNDNLVYDCGLIDGVNRGLLSAFTYRAIADVADYEHIPWRNGRFDLDELTSELATQQRANQVLEEWRNLHGPERQTLGFCCTIRHAEFMAEHFRANGVSAVAVHSGASSSPRVESLERLAAGDLPIIFTVDLFNEGVDVPTVDVVLMLRPTESPVVFFQQLGRGLRRSDGKERLDAVDLVGNHRSFLLKARLLASLAGRTNLTDHEAVGVVAQLAGGKDHDGSPALPDGCLLMVDTAVIDLLQELAGPVRAEDRLVELARQWSDDHNGARPTALQLALTTGKPHSLKARGGWFGFLRQYGLLADVEQRVLELAGQYFVDIEHGSYTKSFKLVTLLAMAQTGTLRTGIPVPTLAANTRWLILRESELSADLTEATGSFADVTQPTFAEWEAYWRKNPVNAWTGGNLAEAARSSAWFEVVNDVFTLRLTVPDELGDTFDAMVNEIVEYRLHRYLVGQKARRVGERRRPTLDGRELDATFVVETSGSRPSSIVIESAGGTAGSDSARNTEYVDGFDLVLARLRDADIRILDIYIDTRLTADLSIADRRLDPGGSVRYPLDLSGIDNLEELRRRLLRSMAAVGRASGTKGGGNQRKRTRFVIGVPDGWTSVALADALASGDQIVLDRRQLDDESTG